MCTAMPPSMDLSFGQQGEERLSSQSEGFVQPAAAADLIDAGVDSLKIEGRMKKPEYAALTAYLYRKYTDLYLTGGREHYHVDQADLEQFNGSV